LIGYLKNQWPIVYKNTTGTDPVPWTDIPNDAAEMQKVEKKFKLKVHEKARFDTGNTNEWDFSLLTNILSLSSLGFVAPSSPESNALNDIKPIRNTLIGHAPDAKIPNAVFKNAWATACKALEEFNATPEEFTAVEEGMCKTDI
jgi:hypothetical protein